MNSTVTELGDVLHILCNLLYQNMMMLCASRQVVDRSKSFNIQVWMLTLSSSHTAYPENQKPTAMEVSCCLTTLQKRLKLFLECLEDFHQLESNILHDHHKEPHEEPLNVSLMRGLEPLMDSLVVNNDLPSEKPQLRCFLQYWDFRLQVFKGSITSQIYFFSDNTDGCLADFPDEPSFRLYLNDVGQEIGVHIKDMADYVQRFAQIGIAPVHAPKT